MTGMLCSVANGKFHKQLTGPVERAKAFRSALTACGLDVQPQNYFEDEAAVNAHTGGRLSTYLCKHCAERL